jgi:hypothetical protein
MEYIGKRNHREYKYLVGGIFRCESDQKASIENENLLDLHGYLINMVEWLKLVGYLSEKFFIRKEFYLCRKHRK